MAGNPRLSPLERALRALSGASALDGPGRTLVGLATRFVQPGPSKDALSGTGLGHPLHPVLTDLPIGFWASAFFLDILGGKRRRTAARRLVGGGILAALPAAFTGLSDLGDVEDKEQRRIGVVHAAANSAATTLFFLSYVARARGRGGRLWATMGIGALTAGGYLGGHLSYRAGIGVSRTAFRPRLEEWTPALAEADLPEDRPRRVEIDGNEIMLFRRGDEIHALANRCTHRGGPLAKGKIEDGCVVCPWHLSKFSLEDGAIVRGPATAPQPAYDVRISDGTIEVRG